MSPEQSVRVALRARPARGSVAGLRVVLGPEWIWDRQRGLLVIGEFNDEWVTANTIFRLWRTMCEPVLNLDGLSGQLQLEVLSQLPLDAKIEGIAAPIFKQMVAPYR